jgi:acid phosphatase type 7
VINGNNHDDEWFAPQYPDGNPDSLRGVGEFVVGTDDKHSHRSFGKIRLNSEIGQADTFGVLKLSLHASSYNWDFVPEAGKRFHDSSSGSCH